MVKNQTKIKCKCGCGEKLLKYDKSWREREYIIGHFVRVNHPMKGKTISDKTRKKINGKNHHMYGRNHSDETKTKMVNAWTDEMKSKQRNRYSGTKLSPERVEIMKNSWTDEMKKQASIRRSKQTFPSENTKIETKIHKLLNENKIYFKTQYIIKTDKRYHQCDIFIPDKKLIIEVDGCYWHGCNQCFEEISETIERQICLDIEINSEIKKQGYELIRIWEHDINNDLSICINKILSEINKPDFSVCLRCNLPYEDVDCMPLCPECEQLIKAITDESLIVA